MQRVELTSDKLRLRWQKQEDGWRLFDLAAKDDQRGWLPLPTPSGLHTILHLNRNPAQYLVEVDREGVAFPFYPRSAERLEDGAISFRQSLSIGEVESRWSIDPAFPTDVCVRISIVTSQPGHVSIASPTLSVFEESDLAWGMIPGNWCGNGVQPNYELSPAYSQGLPNRACLTRERNTMTLCAILTARNGTTIGVIPRPGLASSYWTGDKNTRGDWRVALSTMDRYAQLTPVMYHPVMGQIDAKQEAGATVVSEFRYSIQAAGWFEVFRHAAMDIYRFPELLKLQNSRESLAERVGKLGNMLADDEKSLWKIVELDGVKLGANGTKTSDVGAMYMLARATGDRLLQGRLPYIRNYKLLQQQMRLGFFQHAATGEYPGEAGFVAERGNWIEPLFTTYYTMLDVGNMALFNPDDDELKIRLRLAAEKLIAWQHEDGGFDVAYDSVSHRSSFPFLKDLRPTWYGLLVAARILGDDRYLAAARKGADWYLQHAVGKGHYLGACGDALNIWDFTTVFGSQALLDLHALTDDRKYLDAAVDVARVYSTSIFTHPIPTTETKAVSGVAKQDWEITQVGLSVEHIRGTASSGPVLLSSHAGLFVRMNALTGEQLFLDMARAAARGRQHFTNPETGMSVYYFNAIEDVQKVWASFPWHAEWQVGWITDYLVSEAHLRTGGRASFPAGFPTPKVGSHVAYGFAPGMVYGHAADFWLGDRAVTCAQADVEYLSAMRTDGKGLLLIVLNQSPEMQAATLKVDQTQAAWTACSRLDAGPAARGDPVTGVVQVELAPWGAAVLLLEGASLRGQRPVRS